MCKDPRVHTQLNNGFDTGPWDCGVELTRTLINYASCNKVDVKEDVIRHRMGKAGKVATNPEDWKRAIEHPDTVAEFKAVGLQAPKARLLSGVDFQLAEDDILKGKMVGAAVWYGDINQFAPELSGSHTFNDNHAMGFIGLVANQNSKHSTRLSKGYDSLRDRRGNYPGGVSAFPWYLVKKATGDVHVRTRDSHDRILTERLLGKGLFLGVTVGRAKPIVITPPPPPDSCDEKLAAAQGQIDALQSQNDALLVGLTATKNWIARQRSSLDDLEAAVDVAIQQGGGDQT